MIETTLSKVGNSMAVLLPKTLRQEACIDAEEPLRVESPRKGVVVITSVIGSEDRAERLRAAQKRIAERASRVVPWPAGVTADEMLEQGKEAKADELLLP